MPTQLGSPRHTLLDIPLSLRYLINKNICSSHRLALGSSPEPHSVAPGPRTPAAAKEVSRMAQQRPVPTASVFDGINGRGNSSASSPPRPALRGVPSRDPRSRAMMALHSVATSPSPRMHVANPPFSNASYATPADPTQRRTPPAQVPSLFPSGRASVLPCPSSLASSPVIVESAKIREYIGVPSARGRSYRPESARRRSEQSGEVAWSSSTPSPLRGEGWGESDTYSHTCHPLRAKSPTAVKRHSPAATGDP